MATVHVSIKIRHVPKFNYILNRFQIVRKNGSIWDDPLTHNVCICSVENSTFGLLIPKIEVCFNYIPWFSLSLKCRFFIGLIAQHDCRPNLYVQQANFYVRENGRIIILSVKNESVVLLLLNYVYVNIYFITLFVRVYMVLEKINHLLCLLLTVHGYMLGCSIS